MLVKIFHIGLLPIITLFFVTVKAGNILIFPMFTKSQLLNAARIASILNDDGHQVTLAIPVNDRIDIDPSSKFNILFYETDMSRESEQSVRKEALNLTPFNILLGKVNATMPAIIASRCRGILLNEVFLEKLKLLKPDLAIIHTIMACASAHLSHMNIPYLDFCSAPLFPWICGSAHRIPANPSYVPDGFLSNDEMPFLSRVLNTVVGLVLPRFFWLISAPAESVMNQYQVQHGLPPLSYSKMRSEASFLLVHGDVTFETIRPTLPKVVYIGGVQCDAPKPLEGSLKEFVSQSGNEGLIVFSLGGALDTDALPHGFIETFLNIFRDLPQNIVWKLKSVPKHLMEKVPSNVKIVDWMPQQDLLGHPKTKLFISHGGIQGSFESICHGKPLLGVGLFGDQWVNLRILEKKGMALLVEDYKHLDSEKLKNQIHDLLNNEKYAQKALLAQAMFKDQPLSVSQRIQYAVNYTLRHKGARHLSSKAAMQLNWFQFYLIDVFLFICIIMCIILIFSCLCFKWCLRCLCNSKKRKTE